MNTVTVDLGDRSYPIHVGAGLLARPELFDESSFGREVMVVTNPIVSSLYLDQVLESLGDRIVHVFQFGDGEHEKTLESVNRLFDFMIDVPCDRDVTIVALGGGVVGDMAGFASACYQRGTPFVQIPTTLLAQVDSSVGGKTAVNHPHGKNMIGAFHQPRCVISDTNTLKSLDDRQYRAGLAEVIKYGIIYDGAFFDWLSENKVPVMNRTADAVTHIIATSCEIKAEIVRQDEQEKGIRAILNLGHTFGHAIETFTGYTSWLHGEAVAVGMVMASQMSQAMGLMDASSVSRITALIEDYGLPVNPPIDLHAGEFTTLMQRDKKVRAGVIRLILPTEIGKARLFSDYQHSLLTESIERCRLATASAPRVERRD